jgi:hypothetical protein
MNPYLDSTDPYWFNRVQPNHVEPSKPTKKKDDSIITKKVLVIFAVVAIIKVSILLLWLI